MCYWEINRLLSGCGQLNTANTYSRILETDLNRHIFHRHGNSINYRLHGRTRARVPREHTSVLDICSYVRVLAGRFGGCDEIDCHYRNYLQQTVSRIFTSFCIVLLMRTLHIEYVHQLSGRRYRTHTSCCCVRMGAHMSTPPCSTVGTDVLCDWVTLAMMYVHSFERMEISARDNLRLVHQT